MNIYPEHNDMYLEECLKNLQDKNIKIEICMERYIGVAQIYVKH